MSKLTLEQKKFIKEVVAKSERKLIKKALKKANKEPCFTIQDMERCFIESRMTHPILGFKHQNFQEFLHS